MFLGDMNRKILEVLLGHFANFYPGKVGQPIDVDPFKTASGVGLAHFTAVGKLFGNVGGAVIIPETPEVVFHWLRFFGTLLNDGFYQSTVF
jgi:hypothetical protein